MGEGIACIKSGLTVVILRWLSYLDKDFPSLSYMLGEISVQHTFSLIFTEKIVKKYIWHINSKNLWTRHISLALSLGKLVSVIPGLIGIIVGDIMHAWYTFPY